jgi:hypothetical protein
MLKLYNFIKHIRENYTLETHEIVYIIEKVFSEILSTRFKTKVLVFVTNDNQIIADKIINKNGISEQVSIDIDILKGIKGINKQILFAIQKAEVLNKINSFKKYIGQLKRGTIKQIKDGNIYVDLDLGDINQIAICPNGLYGKHESFKNGQTKAFNIKNIMMSIENNIPVFQILLDRITRKLPENLINEQLSKVEKERAKIRCTKRITGGKSIIYSNKRIKKEIIKAVDRELKERVIIRFHNKNK